MIEIHIILLQTLKKHAWKKPNYECTAVLDCSLIYIQIHYIHLCILLMKYTKIIDALQYLTDSRVKSFTLKTFLLIYYFPPVIPCCSRKSSQNKKGHYLAPQKQKQVEKYFFCLLLLLLVIQRHLSFRPFARCYPKI